MLGCETPRWICSSPLLGCHYFAATESQTKPSLAGMGSIPIHNIYVYAQVFIMYMHMGNCESYDSTMSKGLVIHSWIH